MMIVESGLRSVLSLSYLDSVSLWFGSNKNLLTLFLSFLRPPLYSRDSLRCSLEIICNLCVHVHNRNYILEYNGIDALVSLHCDDDGWIRDLSFRILDHLKDVTPADVLVRKKADLGNYTIFTYIMFLHSSFSLTFHVLSHFLLVLPPPLPSSPIIFFFLFCS